MSITLPKGVTSSGGLDRLLATVERLRTMRVTAGVQAAEAGDVDADGVVTVLDKAIANEFGTRTKDGKVHVPERSFLRAALDRRRREWASGARVDAKAALVGRLTLEVAANRVGNRMRSDIQQQITDTHEPPNAPATIAAKGSSHPLIDTGQLRQSIRYVAELDGVEVGVG